MRNEDFYLIVMRSIQKLSIFAFYKKHFLNKIALCKKQIKQIDDGFAI